MPDTTPPAPRAPTAPAATGVEGLDLVLAGGLTPRRLHLVEGTPGTGKTTIALRFLMEGALRGERGLYVALGETEEELRAGAASHGWALDPLITVEELAPPEALLDPENQQSLLYASDLELGETTARIFAAIERVGPSRVVIDSLSELRLLAQSSLRYRRQLLGLKHAVARYGVTVVALDDMTTETGDKTVHSVAHSVVSLQELAPLYGAERRRLRVIKYRGVRFLGGYHDFVIATGGPRVFPRLRGGAPVAFAREAVPSGSAALDAMLGGGLDRGASVLALGPAGAGKSLLCLGALRAAVERGERVALFLFDEEEGLALHRARAMGFDLAALRDRGLAHVEAVDAAELSPGEFAQRVRNSVDGFGARTVVIDSLNGYQTSMPEEQFLLLHLHELLLFLNRNGVVTLMTVAQSGLIGDMRSPVDLTYLADTVLLLRYFEERGRVRRALSIVKRRLGPHEDSIREVTVGNGGVVVGPTLRNVHGVLRGVPALLDAEPAVPGVPG